MNLLRIEEGEVFTSKQTLTQVDCASHQSLSNGPQNTSNSTVRHYFARISGIDISLDIEMPASSSFTMRCLKHFMIEYRRLVDVTTSKILGVFVGNSLNGWRTTESD